MHIASLLVACTSLTSPSPTASRRLSSDYLFPRSFSRSFAASDTSGRCQFQGKQTTSRWISNHGEAKRIDTEDRYSRVWTTHVRPIHTRNCYAESINTQQHQPVIHSQAHLLYHLQRQLLIHPKMDNQNSLDRRQKRRGELPAADFASIEEERDAEKGARGEGWKDGRSCQ